MMLLIHPYTVFCVFARLLVTYALYSQWGSSKWRRLIWVWIRVYFPVHCLGYLNSSISLGICANKTHCFPQLAGWGVTETGARSSTLKWAYQKYIAYENCRAAIKATDQKYLTHDKFCTGEVKGQWVSGFTSYFVNTKWYSILIDRELLLIVY